MWVWFLFACTCRTEAPGKALAFKSTTRFTGDLRRQASGRGLPAGDGFVAAHALCDAEAREAGLGGTFRAWLFEAPEGTEIGGLGPWVLVNGETVFADRAGSRNGSPRADLVLDARGAPQFDPAWTGVPRMDSLEDPACAGWSATSSTGTVGFGMGFGWNDNETRPCTESHALFCFEHREIGLD